MHSLCRRPLSAPQKQNFLLRINVVEMSMCYGFIAVNSQQRRQGGPRALTGSILVNAYMVFSGERIQLVGRGDREAGTSEAGFLRKSLREKERWPEWKIPMLPHDLIPHADPLLGCLPLLGLRLLGKPALRRKTAFWRNYYLSVLPLPSLPTAFPGGGPSSHHWTCSHCSLPITMHARSTAKILARFLPKKRPCPRCHRAYKHEPGVVPGLGELAGK